MRMTDEQATQYCKSQVEKAIANTSGPGGENVSRAWHRLREEIERDGLDTVETQCNEYLERARGNTDSRKTFDTTVIQQFIDAIENDKEVKKAIAREILVKVEAEWRTQTDHGSPLRQLYLSDLQDFLLEAIDGDKDLEDYDDVAFEIKDAAQHLENEYCTWIDEAIDAQED